MAVYDPRHSEVFDDLRVYQLAEYRSRLDLYRCPKHHELIVYSRVSPSGCLDLLNDLCCEAAAAEIDAAFRAALAS